MAWVVGINVQPRAINSSLLLSDGFSTAPATDSFNVTRNTTAKAVMLQRSPPNTDMFSSALSSPWRPAASAYPTFTVMVSSRNANTSWMGVNTASIAI